MNEKEYVYLVGNAGVEHTEITAVCKTEEAAREEFEKQRRKLIREHKRLRNLDSEYWKDYLKDLEDWKFTTRSCGVLICLPSIMVNTALRYGANSSSILEAGFLALGEYYGSN